MPEFTEFPIPRKDVEDLTSQQQEDVRVALGLPAATQAEAEAGTEPESRTFSPLRVRQASSAQVSRSIIDLYDLAKTGSAIDAGSPTFASAIALMARIDANGKTPGTAHAAIQGFFGSSSGPQVKHNSLNWSDGVIDFSRPGDFVVSTRYTGAADDHAAVGRWTWGKDERAAAQIAAIGDLTVKGFGVRVTAVGTAVTYEVFTHDGTTLRTYEVTGSGLVNNSQNDWRFRNNGDGTGTVFRNGAVAVAEVIMPTGNSASRCTTGWELDITDWQTNTSLRTGQMGAIYEI